MAFTANDNPLLAKRGKTFCHKINVISLRLGPAIFILDAVSYTGGEKVYNTELNSVNFLCIPDIQCDNGTSAVKDGGERTHQGGQQSCQHEATDTCNRYTHVRKKRFTEMNSSLDVENVRSCYTKTHFSHTLRIIDYSKTDLYSKLRSKRSVSQICTSSRTARGK